MSEVNNTNNLGVFILENKHGFIFQNSLSNDVLVYSTKPEQKILIGSSNSSAPASLTVNPANVQINDLLVLSNLQLGCNLAVGRNITASLDLFVDRSAVIGSNLNINSNLFVPRIHASDSLNVANNIFTKTIHATSTATFNSNVDASSLIVRSNADVHLLTSSNAYVGVALIKSLRLERNDLGASSTFSSPTLAPFFLVDAAYNASSPLPFTHRHVVLSSPLATQYLVPNPTSIQNGTIISISNVTNVLHSIYSGSINALFFNNFYQKINIPAYGSVTLLAFNGVFVTHNVFDPSLNSTALVKLT